MDLQKLDFLTILTLSVITEMLFLFSFRFTKLPFTGIPINRWYTNFQWTAIILDILIIIIGFYLAKFVFNYLIENKYIKKYKEIYKNLFLFLIILLVIQITHDILFYHLFILKSKEGNNPIMDELNKYAKKVSFGAVIGDSSMYILSIIIFYLIRNSSNDIKTFLSVLSLYLIGYFIYQKPLK